VGHGLGEGRQRAAAGRRIVDDHLPADGTAGQPDADAPALIFEPAAGSFGTQYNLGPDYLDARRNLVSSLDAKLAELPEETREAVMTNLETIRKAIADINSALARQPDNVLLQELLLNTYREELDLMITVDGAANAAMRRGDI
jgi:hypothetical protein